METLSKLMGRFYILLLYIFAMYAGAMIAGLISIKLFHSDARGILILGGALGYALARPLRNKIAARYGIKSTQTLAGESEARELFSQGCDLNLKGKNTEAIKKYEEIISRHPTLPQAADAKKAIEYIQSMTPPANGEQTP